MSINERPITIVGGGIGGLVLAIALAQKNYKSQVLEQAPQFRELGAGIQLCPNVLKMFDYLNMLPALDDVASYPDDMVFHDALTGSELLRVPYGNSTELVARFGYPLAVFGRGDLLKKLLSECKKYPEITLKTSARVLHYKETKDGVIAITEQGEEIEGEVLVGCDGLWSKIREQLIGDGSPQPSNQIAYRGTIPIQKVNTKLCPNDIVHWNGPNFHVVHYRIGKGELFNIYATFRSEDKLQPSDHDGSNKVDELKKQFSQAHPKVQELLTHVDTQMMWVICDRKPIKEWAKGKVIMMGDAAHPTFPYMTQGAGMAVEDAVVLADKIAKHKGNYTSAFTAFQQDRYLRCAQTTYVSRFNSDFQQADGLMREVANQHLSKMNYTQLYDYLDWAFSGIDL